MQKILIIDFGSQYTQLIARRVRELNVYCEIHPFNHIPEIDADTLGVILSGSPPDGTVFPMCARRSRGRPRNARAPCCR